MLTLTSIDRSFSEEAEKEFQTQIDELGNKAAELSDAEFALGVAAAVALADNGHTNVAIGESHNAYNSVLED